MAVYTSAFLLVCLTFCPFSACLPNYILPEGFNGNRERLIEHYFNLGLSYTEILCFLVAVHGIHISLRQLKRILQQLGLRRRGNLDSINEVITNVEAELRGSGRSAGYRAMHQRLIIKYGQRINRESVRLILKALDPEGVEDRSRRRLRRRKYRAKGPNYIWHMDGYDKLKPFGFCVHGAIDGYSRRILWLEVGTTNNDPSVIAQYFITCVRGVGSAPRIIRADYGTENVNVAAIQRFLRRDCEDAFSGLKSFLYGKSVSNQRIEAWWSTLRRSNSDWWMNFFKDMRDMGLYNDGDPLQVECLRYCFMNVLRNELHQVAKLWNLHRIRPSVNSDSPPGRTDLLYFLPQATDTINYATAVDEDDLDVSEYLADVTNASNSADPAFAELAQIIMDEQNLRMPESAEEARRLYIDLMHEIEALR